MTMANDRRSRSVAREDVLRVWSVVNDHYSRMLSESGRVAALQNASARIQSEIKHKRAVVAELTTKMREIRDYVRELENDTTKVASVAQTDSFAALRSDLLTGEWHFLYLEAGSLFGFMKLVPESSRVRESGNGVCVHEAEFTLPSAVLDEAFAVGDNASSSDRPVTCPRCDSEYSSREYWKHGLQEIIVNGNTVPGYRIVSSDNAVGDVWYVDPASGLREPIYRPRDCYQLCDIGQGFTDLGFGHFLSDKHFTRTLDATFSRLAGQLRQQT